MENFLLLTQELGYIVYKQPHHILRLYVNFLMANNSYNQSLSLFAPNLRTGVKSNQQYHIFLKASAVFLISKNVRLKFRRGFFFALYSR